MKRNVLDEFLEEYHSDKPYSFGSKGHVKDHVNIHSRDISHVLSKSDIYTEYREFKKPKNTPSIRTYGKNYLWEADLMFFTHPDFAEANEGFLYVLAFIDSFTKQVGIVKLKSKDSKTVAENMKIKFEQEKPKYLRVDAGGEFISQIFTKLCNDYEVKLYIAQEPIKCAFIERFNRTFKRILVQIMEHNNSIRWIDYLQQSLDIYHSRKHSSIGMTPNEAMDESKHPKIHSKMLKRYLKDDSIKHEKNSKPSKYKKGQIVKIFNKKNIFSRGYLKSATKEYFKIYHVDRKLSKDRYYLKDLQNEKIIGSFYAEYLIPYTPPDDGGQYKLDPNFKDFKRKKIRGVPHIWVKWLGWPSKFNQWVPMKSVRHIINDLK